MSETTDDASSNVDDFVAAGLYDPDAPGAPARLELLEYLLDLGVSIPEMAATEHGLLSLAAFRTIRPEEGRCTFREAAERADVEHGFALRVWRAAGFPDPRPYDGGSATATSGCSCWRARCNDWSAPTWSCS